MNLERILKNGGILVSRFIEGTISEREEVSAEDLETLELLVLVLHLLLNQLYTL